MWAETLRGRGCSWLWWPFVGHKMIVLKLPITQYTWLQNILKYELNGQKKVQKCNSSGCLFVVITVLPTLMWKNMSGDFGQENIYRFGKIASTMLFFDNVSKHRVLKVLSLLAYVYSTVYVISWRFKVD